MTPVEEFEAAGDPAEKRVTDTPRRRRSRLAPWVATSVALVLVGAATTTPVIPGRGTGLDFGLLDLDLTAPPTVAWESAELELLGLVGTAGDRAVTLAEEPDGNRSYLGIDLADGTEVWRYLDEGHTCQHALPLVCVQEAGSLSAQVVTVDLADGGLGTRPYPGALSAAAAGDDLVVVVKTETLDEDVVLLEPDGTERWRVPVDVVDTQAGFMRVPIQVSETGVTHIAVGAASLVFDPVLDTVPPLDSPVVTLELETGEQQTGGAATFSAKGFILDYSDGDVVITGPDGRVTVRDTEQIMHDDDLGGPVRLEITAAAEFLDAATTVASIRATEEELWRSDPGCFPGARLRGIVVLYCFGGTEVLVGVDELTGEQLWKVRELSWVLAMSPDTLVVTDSAGATLVGVDPRDGRRLWSVAVYGGDAVSRSVAIDGGVLLMIGSRMVRLAWE